jgi:AcrR family transcriptional regulator
MTGEDPREIDPGDPAAAEAERARFVAAFGKAAAEHGYRELTFEQVARFAGSSRERLVLHFGTKEEGLLAAQDAFLEQLRLDAVEACGGSGEWPLRVRAAIASVVSALVEASALARVLTIEATASLAAAERQFAAFDSFAELLRKGRRVYRPAVDLPASTERAIVGGIASMMTVPLLAEDPQALGVLEPELVELTLAPFIGAAEARRVAAREP